MTATGFRSTGAAAAENELLAQLGLPPSASPEDVDELHLAVSTYLAAAPAEIRGWAHAQAAALDKAYITLTDPAGLEGSALRSPASPPVAPEEAATPPAPRGPDSEATSVASEEAVSADDDESEGLDLAGETDVEALAALYASVTPSAHEDMAPAANARPTRKERREARRQSPVAAAPVGATRKAEPNIWKRIVLGGAAVIAIAAVVLGANAIVNGNAGGAPTQATSNGTAAQASPAAPVVDQAKVAELMGKFQADPKDTVTLLALADEFYAVGDYETSATWLDKLLAVDPEHIQAQLARGAIYFNTGDFVTAEKVWRKVAVQEPENSEVHYDLGFLYLNQPTPNWDGVRTEWEKVIAIDPTSQLAQTVKSHLDSFASASMMPGASPGANSSPAASNPASPAASAVP